MTDVRTSLHPFYLTFGVQYEYEEHPYWEGADPAGWVRIMARTHDQAINLARAYFGERYAFLYPEDRFNTDEDRKYYPHGELAVIELGNLAIEGDGPEPIVSASESWLYGVNDRTTIGARIIGRLKSDHVTDSVEKLGYDMEYTHRECFEAGSMLFASIEEVDRNVMAFEMDWADRWQCAVCKRELP